MNAISVSSTCNSQTVHAVVQFLEKYGFVGENSVDPDQLRHLLLWIPMYMYR